MRDGKRDVTPSFLSGLGFFLGVIFLVSVVIATIPVLVTISARGVEHVHDNPQDARAIG